MKDADGWLHSGDIGQWNPNGTLSIIDRKKNIFKLSQGEYVAPEKIENVYMRSAFVQQAFVYGDSLQSSLVGVIVPDAEELCKWATAVGIPDAQNINVLCNSEIVRKAILQDMHTEGHKAKLRGFEQVRAIHVEPVAFSVENDLLTPSFKLKRPQLRQHYGDILKTLYQSLAP